MPRLLPLLLVPVLAAATPAPEIDATSLLAGARELDHEGAPKGDTARLFDGAVDMESQWEPQKTDPTIDAVIQLAEPFDLHRMQVVNSVNEPYYPGISTKTLRIDHAASRKGPWTKLAEVSLKKGTDVQKFDFKPVKGVRYLKLTLLTNYGNAEYWSLAELSVFGRRSKPRAKIDFTGQWDTPYGGMKLVQEGDRITGCYADGSFLVEGTLEGPVFFGTYTENDNRGAMAFALTAEGELAGVYGDITGTSRSNRWDGTKLAKLEMKCGEQKSLADDLKETGRVVLRGILFDTGKDVIKPESVPVLEQLAAAMKEGAGSYVIEGHTDDRGGESMNRTLSEKRAASVKKWLVTHGVAEKALSTVGYGQTRPAMANDSEAGRAANRRVEVARQQ